jgi:hypothetical protein
MLLVPITQRDITRAKKARAQLDQERGPGYDAHDHGGFTPRWKGSLVELAYQRELKRLGIEFVAGEPDLVIGEWEINVKHVAIPEWCRVDYRYIKHPAGNAYAFGRVEGRGPHVELYGWIPAGLYRKCGTFVAAGEETEMHAPYKLDGIELDASKLWSLEALRA